MSEILNDIICWIGISYLLYRIYNLLVSIAKIFTERNKSGSVDILHKRSLNKFIIRIVGKTDIMAENCTG